MNIAINGFGRIGRMVLKAGIKNPKIKWVAVNDLTDTKTLAHLFKHDSIYGTYQGSVKAKKDSIIIDGKEIKVFSEKDPENLPWKKLKIDIVVEATGIFRTKSLADKHIKAGAKKVLLTAPCKSCNKEEIKNFVIGCNEHTYKGEALVSNASCTTNSIAPIIKILHDKFKIKKGYLTTVHSYTADQRLIDAPHKDLRRARNAATNIIPTTTGAAKSVETVIPELKNKLDGIAIRVPTPCGSITDFVCEVEKNTSIKEVNNLIKEKSKKIKVIQYTEEPIVSQDIIGNSHSAIFDAELTRVNKNMIKIFSWYDNEWGYSNRIIEMLNIMKK